MNLKLVVCLFVLGILGFVESRRRSSGAGPFRIVLRKTKNASEDFTSTGAFWFEINSTPYKQGTPQYVWGRSYSSMDFNDDVKVDMFMASWERNKWKKGAFAVTFEKGCSDYLRRAKTVMVLLYGDDGSRCPVRAVGYRQIPNHTLDVSFPHVPVFPYGRWLMTMKLTKKSRTVGIFVAEIETVPK